MLSHTLRDSVPTEPRDPRVSSLGSLRGFNEPTNFTSRDPGWGSVTLGNLDPALDSKIFGEGHFASVLHLLESGE